MAIEAAVRMAADAADDIRMSDAASFADQKSTWLGIVRKHRKSRRQVEIELHRRILSRRQHR